MNETKALVDNEMQNRMPSKRNRGWLIVRLFVAAVLLVAAGMKAHQLATVPSLGEGLLHARWFNILVVEFELFFGIWLIFGMLPKLTWLVTACCFSIFATVSFYKAIFGEASCGCFGAVSINPWITACFDLLVITFLLIFRPKDILISLNELQREGIIIFKHGRPVLAIVLVWFFIASPVTYAMISIEKRNHAELGTEFIGADGKKTIMLEPEKWIGKKFPLLPYFSTSDQAKQLRDGNWILLFFHRDCSKCSQVKSKTEESNIIRNIAFIELPPYDKNNIGIEQNNLQLSSDMAWFAETPIVLTINNSIVEKVVNDLSNFE